MRPPQQEAVKREIEFKLVDDEDMPPIIITMGDNDLPKVVINRKYQIWLSLYRKTIGGCAEALYEKIDELLTAHLSEQRMYEKME
jgi:hypothetical protein|tara:strand:- start:9849 stop:10103 length:255 start_codon:yes stop_codon:yes gene_type:complete